MFAIPGIVALVIFIYARPQEFYEPLRALPLLYIFFGLALFGGYLDLRVGNIKLRSVPQMPWVLGLLAWSTLTVLIRAPAETVEHVIGLFVCFALFFLISHGVQSFRSLHLVAAAVLAMVLFVCGVGAHQGFSSTGCVIIDESIPGDKASGRYDGRPCVTPRSCYTADAEPGAEYQCEKIGLFGTTSIGRGRVRYRGVLQDPNELALAGGVGLPLAFAFGQAERKTLGRRALAIVAFLLVLLCAVLTGSRGGQLVFLAVMGAYFVSRVGVIGLVLGAVLAAPLLLLGGRGGEDASSSTLERLDCWAEGISMFRGHPFLGVGLGQFTEYHYMTAHNSYILAVAELGLPGMFLFIAVVFLSGKVPFAVLRHVPASPNPQVQAGSQLTRAWSVALLAAFIGLAVGIFFLSFTWHYVLWIYLGLSGALYSAVRRHDPTFRVRLGWFDLGLVAAACVGIVGFVTFYTRWKLG
jgi:hypothetical protein